MMASTRTLSTADERRGDVLRAAERAFSARGYHGTPTTEIAKAAGISQAYLFRLFPTKLELFVACVDRCYERTGAVFAAAAREARAQGQEPLAAMGAAYAAMLADPDELLLNLQLQTHAASGEPAVRDASRRGYGDLWELVRRESGADDETLRAWFGMGMLMNVLAAMGADQVDEPWARSLTGSDPC